MLVNRNSYSAGGLILNPVNDFSIFAGVNCCSPDDNDHDLDDFIRDDAEQHLKDKLAVTYGLFFPDEELSRYPLAFLTLQNDSLKINLAGYPYKAFPAVKIGRFGVHSRLQGQGVGTHILNMVKDFMCKDNRTGCRFITLDAYNKENVIRFYKRNGFKFLKDPKPDRRQALMYFNLLETP